MSQTIAVILSGSGYLDGSEIREAVATLWAIDSKGNQSQCFAPNENQPDVMDHLQGAPSSGRRNALTEAARIARGKIRPLAELQPDDYSALILPGGFGAAKLLSGFAAEGSKGTVHPDLLNILQTFYSQKKPIGAICIAPAILALAFPDQGFRLTVGAAGEASEEIEKCGHTHVECAADQCVIDADHRIVTTPAYMFDHGKISEIFTGIQKLVDEVDRLRS